MLNGKDVIMFPTRTRCGEFCNFLEEIRKLNPIRRICLIIDNYSVHKSKMARKMATKLNIRLIYLPPYSPDLNPIEFIWKSIKRAVSGTHARNLEELISIVKDSFIALTSSLSFARNWMWQFLRHKLNLLC
jgi:putative transposase